MRINVTRPSMPSYDDYCNEIRDLWESRWLTNTGSKHHMFKDKLKQYLGVENIELFTNGHMSIELSLEALDLKGEVITTPFTFASTTHAIVRNGLVPVFCDVDRTDYTIDVTKIEKLITKKTCAIVPVHVYGNICNVEEIDRIANKHGLKVLYDAAHSFGEKYKDKGIGGFGDVSCFSFHATKVFNTVEGGAACVKDDSILRKLSELKDFGICDSETVNYVGPNAKMNEFCAAMGLCNLRTIDDDILKRKHIVEKYNCNLEGVPGVFLNQVQKDVVSNYSYYPVLIDESLFGMNRDEVVKKLADHDIGARKYFYPLVNQYNCYKKEYNVSDTPIAYWISCRVLTLPLYSDLDDDSVDEICRIVLDCYKK